MERLILARHGESTYSVRGLNNGDPSVDVVLTPAGEEQARALGRELAGEPIELVVTSNLHRTRETAELAMAGRDVPFEVLPGLADPNVGSYEGKTLDEYRAWAWNAPSDEPCPGGGESRLEIAARVADAYRHVAALEQRTILVVAHGITIAYLLDAAHGLPPAPRLRAPIEYATPFFLGTAEVRRAVEVVDAWLADPTW
ncbi:MAG TPA: histidine phosphatase family protein [Gaiellaceae bacterium]|nr:histidine phosphatase family protein [Gaiellaceae bacterium]